MPSKVIFKLQRNQQVMGMPRLVFVFLSGLSIVYGLYLTLDNISIGP